MAYKIDQKVLAAWHDVVLGQGSIIELNLIDSPEDPYGHQLSQ